MELTRFNCYIGTARGFLLSTTDKPTGIRHVKPDFISEVTALTFDTERKKIFIGYKNGCVHIFDSIQNTYIQEVTNLFGKGSTVGLSYLKTSLIVGKSDGIINIWNGNSNNHFDLNLGENETLNSISCNDNRNCIGTGGEHNDFKIWDIEMQKCIFKAKSLGHDSLNLPIPTSVRGIMFSSEDPHLSYCCTKEGHVLLYDDRAQRRPVVKFLETKASYTTIASSYRERQCLVGTTRGYMQLLDMKVGKCMKTFTTFAGSVTDIVCDPIEPYVFSTSLDRHLRVHHLETKELLQKTYMKVNLTTLLVTPAVKEEKKEQDERDNINSVNIEDGVDLDDEYETIFQNMEVVGEEKKKKKNKRYLEECSKKAVKRHKVKNKH
ncbi:WD repeat-containing protein 74 [Diorhabda carinulata]|uniref:WD repeat-containing protein 74 n=1 Tax=Diorhabda carinulata TaxID=1163345 RepID=UPI0025A232BE|nr:WD repeat-containing protein 74 [Diorhabda carinulata]XP_057662035.1 WD repeat-containing protein 74 [Diorhabda carinulata]